MANRLACLMSGQDVATTAQQASVFHTLNSLQHSGFPGLGAATLPPWMMMASQQNVGGSDGMTSHVESGSTVSGSHSNTMNPTNETLGIPQQPWDNEMMELANLAQHFEGFPSTQTPGNAAPGPSTMQYLNSNRAEFDQPPSMDQPGPSSVRTSKQIEERNSGDAWANTSSRESIVESPLPAPSKHHGKATAQPLDQPPPDDESAEVVRNGQSAILGAIANQVGYIEGDHGEPYLRVYYYRVVSCISSTQSRWASC